ncbi:hypothetical protein B0H11DRAFT_2215011 [Mycena galericulata]|nr:hypothetical protein B0H11DRAFT_2215011 [Mycena galericulata]
MSRRGTRANPVVVPDNSPVRTRRLYINRGPPSAIPRTLSTSAGGRSDASTSTSGSAAPVAPTAQRTLADIADDLVAVRARIAFLESDPSNFPMRRAQTARAHAGTPYARPAPSGSRPAAASASNTGVPGARHRMTEEVELRGGCRTERAEPLVHKDLWLDGKGPKWQTPIASGVLPLRPQPLLRLHSAVVGTGLEVPRLRDNHVSRTIPAVR